MRNAKLITTVLLGLTAINAYADVVTAQQLIDKYSVAAKQADPTYAGPNAADGKTFFTREVIQFRGNRDKTGKAIACASCHTSNPADPGKHIVTEKTIKPLSPVVNPQRFSSLDKVEKQFTKHCNDIVGSDCTPQEKANFITYLLTEKTPSSKK